MKKILSVVVTFFSIVLIVFLATAFVKMQINPALWSEDARFFFVIGALFLGLLASAGMASAIDE